MRATRSGGAARERTTARGARTCWAVLLLVLVGSAAAAGVDGDPRSSSGRDSGGRANGIAWKPFDDALGEAQRDGKMLVVVIEKPWCPSCVLLGKVFAESTEVQGLSRRFVMSRLQSEEATGRIFQLDGKYYPRMFFLDQRGEILEELQNFGGSNSARYSFSTESEVVETMRRALDLVASQHREL